MDKIQKQLNTEIDSIKEMDKLQYANLSRNRIHQKLLLISIKRSVSSTERPKRRAGNSRRLINDVSTGLFVSRAFYTSFDYRGICTGA